MTQFARSTNTSTIYVQSPDPVDLQDKVNAAIASVATAAPNFTYITGITLAGAGDGHTFVVAIDYATAANVSGDPLVAGAALVRCYLAADAAELAVSRPAAPSPVASFPYLLADDQVAGSSKGTRFMGMAVYGLSTAPGGFVTASLLATANTQAIAAPGAHIVTFAALDTDSQQFTLTDAGQSLTYGGPQYLKMSLHASVSVEQDSAGPNTVLVEILQDPLGTPVVVGSMTVEVTGANEMENISVDGLTILTTAAGTNKLGLRVTVDSAGSVAAASLTAVPVR